MTRTIRLARLAIFALCLAAPAGVASATAMNTPTPTPAATPAPTQTPLSAEQLSLQGFGLQNATCLEWSDSCSICQRDEADEVHCSTPGIACQPEAFVCRREKAK